MELARNVAYRIIMMNIRLSLCKLVDGLTL